MIEEVVRKIEVGKIYEAKVIKIEDFGCFVQLWPGCEGLFMYHNLLMKEQKKVEKVVKLGDEIIVKALGPDKKGRQTFSRKDALPAAKEKSNKRKKLIYDLKGPKVLFCFLTKMVDRGYNYQYNKE